MLPYWNSLETVTTIYKGFYLAGIVLLGVVVLTEMVAYIYGNRKDTLTEIAEQTRVKDANDKIAGLQARLAQRTLTEDQKQTLIAALLPFKGQKAQVYCNLGDIDGKRYAADFVNVLTKAHWDLGSEPGVSQGVFNENEPGTEDPGGIEVTIHGDARYTHDFPEAAKAFVRTLVDLHLLPEKRCAMNQQVPVGVIHLRIGRK